MTIADPERTEASAYAKRRQAPPVLIPAAGEARLLEPVSQGYDEGWIQDRIHQHPSILPIWEIEPACWPAVPVCKELPLPSGFADNLLVSPDGNLVIVECKLWRNPEARRKVVAQIIDYAKDLVGIDYSALERRIQQGQGVCGGSLYEIAHTSLDEPEFVDAVSRNLRLGRVLLLIAGDGITESVESITHYLQQHAGIHFTLALVQLAVYDAGGGDLVVVPSVPLRSVNVVRGIVDVRDDRAVVSAPPIAPRAGTLTEEQFLEELDRLRPGTRDRLFELLELGQDLGLSREVKKTLLIRLPLGELGYVNVLVVYRNGNADSSYIWWMRETLGADLLMRFLEEWAALSPGAEIVHTPKAPYLKMRDRALTLWDILDHRDTWLAAVRRLRDAALDRQADTEPR